MWGTRGALAFALGLRGALRGDVRFCKRGGFGDTLLCKIHETLGPLCKYGWHCFRGAATYIVRNFAAELNTCSRKKLTATTVVGDAKATKRPFITHCFPCKIF
jgi:hypothetical protein